jgi:hypothetical protein
VDFEIAEGAEVLLEFYLVACDMLSASIAACNGKRELTGRDID